MHPLVETLVVVAGSYGFAALYAQLVADRVLFRARRATYRDGPRVSKIAADDGTAITALHLRPDPDRWSATSRRASGSRPQLTPPGDREPPLSGESPARNLAFDGLSPTARERRGIVLFLHGNAEDLGELLPRLEEFPRRGYAVLAIDYRGYGTTPGRADEASVVADSAAALRHLCAVEGVEPRDVILYGRSLGGGPAVVLAARERVGALILDGAFTSAFRVITRVPILPFDRFPNIERLPAVRCPVLILHGTADRTVPFSHARCLLAAAPPGTAHLWVEGAGHNDLVEAAGEAYWDAIGRLAAEVQLSR